jgi:hypothetical protein
MMINISALGGTIMLRRILMFISVLAVALSMIGVSALRASADESPPTLSPTQGAPGTHVTASATDWSGCSSMSVSGWGQTLGTATINSTGAFTLPFTVPSNAALGAAQLQFSPTCTHSTVLTVVTFTVTAPSTVTSAPAAPSNLTATAVDQHNIRLNWRDNSNNETGFEINNGVVSRDAGANSTTYTWGGLAPGTYMCFKVRAYNSAGDSPWDPNVSPWYVCTTTPKPQPATNPTIYWSRTSGPPGIHFTLTGNGWAPGGTVQVHLPSKGSFYSNASWSVDSHGDWQQNFTVGDARLGAYTLSFSENTGHLQVTGSFSVLVAPTMTNKTWDGYEVNYGQRYTSVSANWTEPQYPPVAAVLHSGLAAFWVGLGGINSHLQQIGTAVGYGVPLKNGKQTSAYYAWYETVPDNPNHPALINKPVMPGDKFSASVTYSGNSYTLKLTDITRGWTFTQVIHQKYDTASAEVVMESPSSAWPPGLSPVTFSGIKVNGASMQNPTPLIDQPNATHVSSFQNDSFIAYPT